MLVVGAVLGLMAGAEISAKRVIAPPQWFGFIERINIYGFLLWVTVLAAALLRGEKAPQAQLTETPEQVKKENFPKYEANG